MGTARAEILKLKRSLSGVIVVLLPVALVIAGAATQLGDREQPEDGWHTIWLQSVGFYGLFPLAVGVAILGSLVWQPEHRGSNWNAVHSGPTSSLRIVLAKAAVVAGLAAVMQVVMLTAILVVGTLVFGLPGILPEEYFGTTLLIMLAVVPVAALQSALSMFIRSFAAPIAVALVGTGLSTGMLMVAGDVAIASPYGLATRATQLGTGTFADTGAVTVGDVTSIVVSALVLTVGVTATSTAILDRRDTRT